MRLQARQRLMVRGATLAATAASSVPVDGLIVAPPTRSRRFAHDALPVLGGERDVKPRYVMGEAALREDGSRTPRLRSARRPERSRRRSWVRELAASPPRGRLRRH